jgi:2-oxoglutarate/2-oxoacid ferredoxin oxidoreductase subunit alpha
MVPVLLLTDGFIANGSEPWKIPQMKELPVITPPIAVKNDEPYLSYKRDEVRFRREWAIPGTPGLEHIVGGLEKTVRGTVSYVPENHELMVKARAEKVARVVEKVPDLTVHGAQTGDLLVVGWGGTYGHLLTATRDLVASGRKVGFTHFNYINPMPANVAEVFSRFKKIVVCELNLGQFANYLRMNFQEFKYEQYNKVQGLPFTIREIKQNCIKLLEEK